MIKNRSFRLGPIRLWFEKRDGESQYRRIPWAFNVGPTTYIPNGNCLRTTRGTLSWIGRVLDSQPAGTTGLGVEYVVKDYETDQMREVTVSLGRKRSWLEIHWNEYCEGDEDESLEVGGFKAADAWDE